MRTFQPDAQLRWHAAPDHDPAWAELYASRMQRTHFNHRTFRELEKAIRLSLSGAPVSPAMSLALGWVLLQDRVTAAGIGEVRDIVAQLPPSEARDRLGGVASQLQSNIDSNEVGYVPPRVNWSVNNTCPMICKGCYNVFTDRELSTDEALAVVQRLDAAGVGAVMISGGDPLFWEPLEEVLTELRRRGMRVGLDTTGHPALRRRLDRVLPLIDSLGIPLESLDVATATRFRRGAGDDVVEYALELLARPDLPVTRVHTVVTRWNVEDLPGLLNRIESLAGVQEWALYQFWPRRIGVQQTGTMTVSQQEFEDAVLGLQPRRIEMFSYPYRERAFMNAMILANGELVTFGEQPGEEFMAGNVLEADLEDIFASAAVRQGKLVRRLVAGSNEGSPT